MKSLAEKFKTSLSTTYDVVRSHRMAKLASMKNTPVSDSRLTPVVDEVIIADEDGIACATNPRVASVAWPMGVMTPSSSLEKPTFWANSTCRGVYEIFSDTSSLGTSTTASSNDTKSPVTEHFVFDAASVRTKVTSLKRCRNPRQFATPEEEEEFKLRKRAYQQWYRDTQRARTQARDERLAILEMIVAKI
jgi:hypothetical protein